MIINREKKPNIEELQSDEGVPVWLVWSPGRQR